uniref:Reverse transcriptase domain-containing protein n=1 Tax=Oryzias latipes TaxID=8090 RepID=A0A3P9JT56_ORYLA
SAARLLSVSCTPDPVIVTALSAVLDHFEPVTLSETSEIVQHLRPSYCPGDSIPPRLLKEVFSSIGPWVVSFINTSLLSGCVPAAFKHAVVQPLLKKSSLDPSVLSNFRPISKLPFLSKILEKVVYFQLQDHLELYGILDKFQSGFRARHSTETSLLRVCNDLFLTVDSGASAVLILLDLTAAFDTVNHDILLSRLEHSVGVKGTALQWFKSYLSNRSFSVQLGPFSSTKVPLGHGVPQGSILGPILFSLYLLPLGSIFEKHHVSYHCYADDIQIYLPLKSGGVQCVENLQRCLEEVKAWMNLNFLSLNESKTEVLRFGKTDLLTGCSSAIGSLDSNQSFIRNLGVILDCHFKFDKQVSAVVQSSFYHLRLLSKVKPYLPHDTLERVVHAFIFSRLDYCNSLYSGINQSLLHRLQLVQNSAARLLTGTRRRDHITPILRSLHWLPVSFRIDFKILLLVFKCLNGLAPPYLSELLQSHRPRRALRSVDQMLLEVPRTRLVTKGDRAFSVVAPKLWNRLPLSMRSARSLNDFKSLLKTHLFTLAFNTRENDRQFFF